MTLPQNVMIDRESLEILRDAANSAMLALDPDEDDDDAVAGIPSNQIEVAIANADATLSETI